ncbi:hypothetical protein BASA50_008706 [Batrachochytrium salamandrivorans]|uniref:Uncharacterized protein n=1 Tax=Batrachochytrium salamandrivorans TaxID=1357716 RepID=A0ABQ8F3Y5_9FUNG|nr:hypothetical protein BASA50_008706 [Batrachochytrium salamandrivorans]
MRRRKIKKRKLKSKQTVTYLALSDEHKAKLKEIKAEYADVTKEYDETWEELIAKEGSAESLGVAPLEEMIERDTFFNGKMRLMQISPIGSRTMVRENAKVNNIEAFIGRSILHYKITSNAYPI